MPLPFEKAFLIVLDGFGLAERGPGNAITEAGVPYLESLLARYPAVSLAAAGLVVGLPWGQPGNSEVGHSAIGTGRIVIQDLAHINTEIRSGAFFKNAELIGGIDHAVKKGTALHLIGCTSPGGIHAHTDHLIALMEMAHRRGARKIYVHFIADGQDAAPQDAINVLHSLEPYLKKFGAVVASVQGRSFAMDRVLNWRLTERVWHAVVVGDARPISDVGTYLQESYEQGKTDYAIEPATVMTKEGVPVGLVQDNDSVIFFDFRNDRVRQLASPFIFAPTFDSFDPVRRPAGLRVTTMTKYAEEFSVPVAYPAIPLPNTAGEIMSKAGFRQYRIAEKEKEAHVTNFFNGGRIEPFSGEERVIVTSRQMTGEEYLAHPEMSAEKIVDVVMEHLDADARLFVINFANPDMIAHAGNLQATMEAMRVVDRCLERLIEAIRGRSDSVVVITADHGNAEELVDPLTGGEDTQHSTRNVPTIFIAPELDGQGGKTLEGLALEAPVGTLVDIAPTVLYLLGIEKPPEMTGSRLITISSGAAARKI
ncbi:MAG: 2,3-bisphosphoglycerate-independent phosphoglycerate mutase [Candidatus Yanofskybacteria bacterium]|nr:2,3-bisphosphoglycerate-independent phosphoglycerate mutase [Candidatus Yanofskybacteria bacterium]